MSPRLHKLEQLVHERARRAAAVGVRDILVVALHRRKAPLALRVHADRADDTCAHTWQALDRQEKT